MFSFVLIGIAYASSRPLAFLHDRSILPVRSFGEGQADEARVFGGQANEGRLFGGQVNAERASGQADEGGASIQADEERVFMQANEERASRRADEERTSGLVNKGRASGQANEGRASGNDERAFDGQQEREQSNKGRASGGRANDASMVKAGEQQEDDVNSSQDGAAAGQNTWAVAAWVRKLEPFFGTESSQEMNMKIKVWHDQFERNFGFPAQTKRAFEKYTKGNAGVLDIGANVGVFSETARRMCPGCDIAAFECVPHFARFMRDNLKSDSKIMVFPFGLSNSEEPLKLWADTNNLGWNTVIASMVTEGMFEIKARFFRLDDVPKSLLPSKIGLIKIDTEGAEWRVIEGAKQTLAALPRPKPALLIEVAWGEKHPDRQKEVAALEWLMSNGWKRQPLDCVNTCDMIFEPEEA